MEAEESAALEGLRFDRLCRTSHSESYLISQGEEAIARVELHFTSSVVYGLLIIEREMAEADVSALIGRIDDDLVSSADLPRDDFIVSVYRGQEIGVFSDSDSSDEEDDDGFA